MTEKFKPVQQDKGKKIYPDKSEKDEYALEVARRYRENWRNVHKTKLSMRFAYDGESDVIAKLDSTPDKIGYIRNLILKDIGG